MVRSSAGLLAAVLSATSLVGAAHSGPGGPGADGPPTPPPAAVAASTTGRGAAPLAHAPGGGAAGGRQNTEARKTDRVPTPQPEWFDCSSIFGAGECATVDLPLDYDQPRGATTGVAVLRIPAADQDNKIGTLFVNPGGPGGSGVEMASYAEYFLSEELLARFDVVGFDPRGVGYSDNVRCWKNAGAQQADLSGLMEVFPDTDEEDAAAVTSARAFGRACSTTGATMAGSVSTAEVARDMDVLRRMVGDEQLTYLGFSYGTYLGNVYANMFPERVRAVVIDGVLDPLAWTNAEASVPSTMRLGSGDAGAAALNEILDRCGSAGPEYCRLASYGDPETLYAELVETLKAAPLEIVDPETGESYGTIDYPSLVSLLLSDLYGPDASSWIDADLSYVLELLAAPADEGSAAAARQDAARAALMAKVDVIKDQQEQFAAARAERQAAVGFAFPYDNNSEAFQSVLCTDGRNPRQIGRWPAFADQSDAKAPGFGPLWTWASAPCGSEAWKVKDEDAYAGPFTTATTNPVLVVGNYWDPATPYQGAVAAARLLPNSRLLSSDSWGHTAYGTSACVTGAVDAYLVDGTLPDAGTVCTGDLQPFTTPLNAEGEAEVPDEARVREDPAAAASIDGSDADEAFPAPAPTQVPDDEKGLPPVIPPAPDAVPRF